MSHVQAIQVGSTFIEAYYSALDEKRPGIEKFYYDDADVSFEGQLLHGKSDIASRLSGIAERMIQRVLSSSDFLSVNETDVIVLVTGNMARDNDPPMYFSDNFYLKFNTAVNSYHISRQIFRLRTNDV